MYSKIERGEIKATRTILLALKEVLKAFNLLYIIKTKQHLEVYKPLKEVFKNHILS